MVRHRRNNGLAGIVMLIGVLLLASGSTLPWGEFTIGDGLPTPQLPYQGSHVFGFDQTFHADGSVSDFGRTLLIISGVVALCALALFATRIRGLGAVWRVLSLASLVPVALVVGSLWSIFDETPGTDLSRADSAPVRAFGETMLTSGTHSSVGPGLMLITIGFGLAVVGSLIPAFRSKQVVRDPGAPPPRYGDYLQPATRV